MRCHELREQFVNQVRSKAHEIDNRFALPETCGQIIRRILQGAFAALNITDIGTQTLLQDLQCFVSFYGVVEIY